MPKENKYLKNTIILSIGKFATQFIAIVLLPLFTRYLSPSDYGYIDLIQTYINLFIPLFLLCFDTAIFRFLVDSRDDKKGIERIISSSLIILGVQLLFLTILSALLLFVFSIHYYLLTVINIASLMISNVLLQVCRGLGKNTYYSISSIIIAIFNLIINIVLILFFNFNASSILIASIIGNIVASIYIVIKIKLITFVNFNSINMDVIRGMLNFALPMVPHTFSWWIVNVSDRTLIALFLATSANGIYTISCKFSNIINSIFSIFLMSWQEEASLHIDDKEKSHFFSKHINDTLILFLSLIILCLTTIPIVYNFIIGKNYIESYNYIPILLIACLFSIATTLLGGIYVAKKLTKEVAKTSFLSALINLIINLILIKELEIYAACVSTLISYLVMFVYRLIDVKKYINLKFNYNKIFPLLLLLVVSSFVYYTSNKLFCSILFLIDLVACSYFNKELLLDFKNIIFNRIHKSN